MTTSNLDRSNDRAARRLRVGGLLALVLLLAQAGMAHAGSEERKATSGATELMIPFGARGTALGATVVGDVEGVESIYWNPAGLAATEGTEAMFSHTEYFAGMKLNDAAVAARWGRVGTLAVTAKVLSVGELIQTTEAAPEGTGQTFNPTFTVLGFSYARQFTDRVRFGATVDYIDERILDNSAQGVGFDFGVQFDAGARGFRFGMAMKNFGPNMEFHGPDFDVSLRNPATDPSSTNRAFSTSSAPFELPSFFVLGATYDLYHYGAYRLAAKSAFQNNNFVGDDVWGALEWSWRDQFALRGSWFGSSTGRTDPATGAESGGFGAGDDLYSGWALGAGTNLGVGASRISVDFAWRPVRSPFDDVAEFGARVRF
jgi:hypothetical protein